MLKIVPVGPLIDHFPAPHKRGLVLHTTSIPTALSALSQFMDVPEFFGPYRWRVFVGTSWKKARELNEANIRWGQFGTNGVQKVWLVPGLIGHDPATLTAIAIQIAIAAATAAIQMLLAPKPQDGKDQRKSVLYSGGLNTSTVGAPLAYLAGLKVFCGSQILEGDIRSLQNAGGGSAYVEGDDAVTGDDDGNVSPPGGGGGTPDPTTDWVDTGRGVFGDFQRDDSDVIISGAGGGGGRSVSNQNITYAQLMALLAPGCGETDGPYGADVHEKLSNIYLDRVPLWDLATSKFTRQGVQVTWRRGVLGQANVALVPGIPTPRETTDVLVYNSVADKAVQTVDADSVNVRVRCRLMFTGRDGNQHPETMSLRFDVKRANDATWTTQRNWSITVKNSEGFDTDIPLTAPPKTEDPDEGWRFRVTRLTADAEIDRRILDASLVGWSEIIHTDLTYDGSAGHPAVSLLGFKIASVDDGKGDFPEAAVIWSGRKVRVPSNYNPVTRVYTGIWNGAWQWAATENPVWLWLDMMTATDGMGQGLADSLFNPFQLYQQAQYCDETVEGKARWTCNKQFTDERGFWEHISEFCKTFRAIPYYDGAQFYLSMDRPGLPVAHYVNNDMVENGEFKWDTTEAENRYNTVEVEWDDPAKFYEKSTTTYRDTVDIERNKLKGIGNGGVVPMRVYKEGCTSEREAYRYAQELAWCSLNETQLANFKTSLNGADYRPGDRIEIEDWLTSGQAPLGRVASVVDTNTFKLPIPFTFAAGVEYKLYAQVGQTRLVRSLPIQGSTVTTDTVTLIAHGMQAGHPIGIANPLTTVPWQGIIRSIEEDGPGVYSVNCQQWREEKFTAFSGLGATPTTDFPTFDRSVGAPSELMLKQYSFMDEVRGVVIRIELHWTAAPGNQVVYRLKHLGPNDTAFKAIDTTTFTFHEVEVSERGQHRFTVQAVNPWAQSAPIQEKITVGEDTDHLFQAPILKAFA